MSKSRKATASEGKKETVKLLDVAFVKNHMQGETEAISSQSAEIYQFVISSGVALELLEHNEIKIQLLPIIIEIITLFEENFLKLNAEFVMNPSISPRFQAIWGPLSHLSVMMSNIKKY